MINGASDAGRAGASRQRRSRAAREALLGGAGSPRTRQAVWGFPNAGVSISSTSTPGAGRSADPRTDRSFYRQTANGPCPSFEEAGPIEWRDVEQHRRAGPGSFSPASGAWLKGGCTAGSRGAIASTGCGSKSWLWSIACWCRKTPRRRIGIWRNPWLLREVP